ncbi:MAG TPA: FCD domain-containing protein [Anaerolineales bacterium]|nr:FCD domain-containing protein [Anaerolineales bacterium]
MSLRDLSQEYGVSIAMLREQLSVARALGLVDVKPGTCIQSLPYEFAPAVQASLSYALSLDRNFFPQFSNLRRNIEKDYWFEAVEALKEEDFNHLNSLVEKAWTKLESKPARLPHKEHRELHMTIYGKVENVFVVGLLEAYWDAYEQVGLNQYTKLEYLKGVWEYHRKIVEAISAGDNELGYNYMLEHMDLIHESLAADI